MEGTSITDLSKLQPLIDLDPVVYRAGFAADAQVKKQAIEEGVEDWESYRENLDYTAFALGNVKTVILDILGKFSEDYRGFLSGSGNFREQIATLLPYKGNRDPSHKPKYYREIKEYMIERWNAEVIDGREADDALGCAQWEKKDRSTVICTIDKDLDNIPGFHYNIRTGEFYDVSLAEANLFFFKQMLVGDRVDNIPGIKSIGDKRADKLLDENGRDLEKVRAAVQEKYRQQYGETWEQAYREVADLLWIERVEGKKCPFLF